MPATQPRSAQSAIDGYATRFVRLFAAGFPPNISARRSQRLSPDAPELGACQWPPGRRDDRPGVSAVRPPSVRGRAAACGAAPGYYRRFSWALAREALRRRNTPLVRRPFVASRLAGSVATGRAPWFEGRRAIFLMQLEDVLAGDEVRALR